MSLFLLLLFPSATHLNIDYFDFLYFFPFKAIHKQMTSLYTFHFVVILIASHCLACQSFRITLLFFLITNKMHPFCFFRTYSTNIPIDPMKGCLAWARLQAISSMVNQVVLGIYALLLISTPNYARQQST